MSVSAEMLMEFENPCERFIGKRQSVQGFAIHGELGFVLFHTGICAVYELAARSGQPLGVFKLGSYNPGIPDNRYTNHANDAMFAKEKFSPEDELPLLYVTSGNSGESDGDGYIGRCAVERIVRKNGVFSAETVQTVCFRRDDGELAAAGFEAPGWGWPASLVDSEEKAFYLFSARYRTTKAFIDKYAENAFVITKFKLPEIREPGEKVILTASDIEDQFTAGFDVLFTQGGTIRNRKLLYTFGAGNADYPNALRVFDLDRRTMSDRFDLSDTAFANEEVECCAFLQGELIINTQAGRLYKLNIKI